VDPSTWYLIISLVLMALSYALAPKPKVTKPDIQEGSIPTASASDPIPVIFGEVEIAFSNCVFWGDQDTTPIKTKGGKK
jgi:hypothetical protein